MLESEEAFDFAIDNECGQRPAGDLANTGLGEQDVGHVGEAAGEGWRLGRLMAVNGALLRVGSMGGWGC